MMAVVRALACSIALVSVLSIGRPATAQHKLATEIVAQLGHTGGVNALAFSPDGRLLASGSDTVRLWDVASGRLLRSIRNPVGGVYDVWFSRDGIRLFAASSGRRVEVLDPSSGEYVKLIELDNNMYHGDPSPDGRLVIASGMGPLEVRDLTTGNLVRKYDFSSSEGGEARASFSPDGKLIVAAHDRTITLWDAGSGRKVRAFEAHPRKTNRVIFSPDGLHLLSHGWTDTLKLWEAASGRLVATFDRPPGGVIPAFVFSPDGRTLAVEGDNNEGSVHIRDARTGKILREMRHSPQALAFSRDGRLLASGSFDGSIKLWDPQSGALLRIISATTSNTYAWDDNKDVNEAKMDEGDARSVAVSPDGRLMATGRGFGGVKVWDATAGRMIADVPGFTSPMQFTPDSRELLAASGQGKGFALLDPASGSVIRTFEGHAKPVLSIAVSADGGRFLSGSADNTIKLWERATGKLLRTLTGHDFFVTGVAFVPGGDQVFSTGPMGGCRIWNIAEKASWMSRIGSLLTRDQIATFACNENRGTNGKAFSLSQDARFLAMGVDDEKAIGNTTIRIYAAETGQPLRDFVKPHKTQVTSLAFSSDGSMLLSGSQDPEIKLWIFEKGNYQALRTVKTFRGHAGDILSLAFMPNDRRFISASQDGTLRLWDIESGSTVLRMMSRRSGEWLALTADGFFDASREPDAMMHIVRGFDVTTIGQVHQSLYNPDLVRETIAGDANGEVREAAKVVNLDKVLASGPAPTVAILPRLEGNRAMGDLVTLQARIIDRGKGIGRVEWRVNGVTAAVAAKPASRGAEITLTQQLALDAGENIVEVVAYNAGDLLASVPARTSITAKDWTGGKKPKLHILAVGINSYVDEGVRRGNDLLRFGPLALAVKDATTLAGDLKRAAMADYASVNVTLALDAQATRANLDRIVDRLAGEVHSRDTFVLFIAAHGASENGRFYVIPQDFQSGSGYLSRDAIGQDRLQDWLSNRIKARRALILLDTCESGALVQGYARSRDGRGADAAVGRLHEATGRPILTAAASGKPALEGYKGHGVFTFALLGALRHGDRSGNGMIELSELVAYVQESVPKLSAELGGAGRAATTGFRASGAGDAPTQSARFGTRGGDFVLTSRLLQ
ncbi:MAG: caspase family protein [Hyphomicrobiaceae bacterium]|nr:caspase family protein [Hyphomicrobiaceae bacterium]